MFHFIAHHAELLIAPTNALVLLCLLGLGLQWPARTARWGRRLSIGCLMLLVVLALSPLGDKLIGSLETRFPPFKPDGAPVRGIIVLGGLASAAGPPGSVLWQPNQAVDRLFEAARLARAFPDAPVLISAGPEDPVSHAAEADAIAGYLVDLGVKPERLIEERRSSDTFQNARFSAAMVKPRPQERWLLVTSAFHMPRAMGCFRKAGFSVTAAPSDWRSSQGPGDWSASQNLSEVDLAVREYLGLLSYRLFGRTNELMPGPKSEQAR
jgi:uncharacterized SAM-binding protein YcdF (DUF218 family)